MSEPRHLMILASAGSGKTYALTSRFVRLLAAGARPAKIVALTFTRKAAGEFFDEILTKLAGAAADAARARELAREIGRPELGRADFLGFLRGVTEAMPRLRLGTLDSFFARIARSFPLELGLAGEFEILHEHAEHRERRRVLQTMFARAGELDDAQRDFIEAFKRATFGREEKRLGAQLDAFLDANQQVYLAAPDAACWGDPDRIWPRGNAWWEGKPSAADAVRGLRAWLAVAAPAEKQRKRWDDFLAAAEQWRPGAESADELWYVLRKILASWPEVRAGRATLEFDRKKQELDPRACAALADLARVVVGGELRRRIEMTRGIFAVLRGYERTYHDAVRRAGRLTFADVQRLLAPAAGAPLLSQAQADGRLAIDYRLDAEIDHWLLDEFQDTSFGQWSVLKNLIDEVVQDPSGLRSFFCVGDVKQAIYSWREGDPRLFREIHRHYTAAAPGAIATGHLDQSWRAGPPVIAMVNRVLGDAVALSRLFPGAMSDAWNAEWRTHVSAVPGRNGQAAWLLAADEAGRWETALALLRELRPLERGLTCAVLVQTNRVAAELADYLRRAGSLPAVAESDLSVCTDNPLGAAALALVQAAAHPGDNLAWEHVQMTPFRHVLERAGVGSRAELSRYALARIRQSGFEHALAEWLESVATYLPADDAFSRERARQLVDAARLFDETGSRDAGEFIDFMERYTVREPEGAAVVRVMTIHKAKGLGFDVVVLPDLEGNRLDQARTGLAVKKAADRSVEWVLDLPPKLITEHDDVLAAYLRQAEAEAGYEALSLLYVALTRAKRGLYVVTEPPGDSASRNYRRVLAETLAEGSASSVEIQIGGLKLRGVWQEGDSRWHEAIVASAGGPGFHDLGPTSVGRRGLRRLEARRPSASEDARVSARLFTLQARDAAHFGTAVHELLAQIEWAPAGPAVEKWTSQAPESVVAEAVAVLNSPALAGIWLRPVGGEVWRERSFEMVWDDAWVTGTIDRVVVERDGSTGLPLRAAVYDFKTDRTGAQELEASARAYAGQMRLYRQAVARLTGLPLEAVKGTLVFTHARLAVESGG